jgi:ATP-binding cassette subfamily B protein
MSRGIRTWLARQAVLVRLYARVDRPLTFLLLAGTVLAGVLTPAFTLATGSLAAAVAAGHRMGIALCATAGIFVIQRLLGPGQNELAGALARRVDEALTERTMAAIGGPPGLAHLEDPVVLDAIAKAQGALVGVSPGQSAACFGGVWSQRLQGALALAIVSTWHGWVAIGLAAVHALAFKVARWHWLQVTQVIYGRTAQLRRAYYLRGLALGAPLAKETRVFGLAPWLVDSYRGSWLAVMREIWHRRSEGWLAALGVFALVGAAEAGTLALVARAGVLGQLSLGRAVTVVQAVLAAGVLAQFHDGHWYLAEAAASLEQIEGLERTVPSTGGVTGGTVSADGLPGQCIRFEGVGFGYPGRDRPVLQGLDLEIPAGKSLAIVGDNGAGKTTLVKLLARLYDPQSGRITVDGVDLRQLEPRAWHRRVAAIFQDFAQFELSALDNVTFGALARREDRAAATLAAERAGAGGIVGRLANGWDTPLSRQIKGGTQLSGGEWQRLALARALFAVEAGAGVLVLDEPTAALDVRGEAEVYQRFLELTRGVTTVVISHRFSTVRRADRIVVLEQGRVIEDGTHDQLIAHGGRYATMYSLQAARFDSAATSEHPSDA